MGINLEDLMIKAPLHPTRQWNLNDRAYEEYRVYGFIGDLYVGRINITRGLNIARSYSDSFFLDLTQEPPVPKPYVSYQETEKQLRGKSISGRIIILANEFYTGKLGTTLYSDIVFVHSFKTQSKRVWQKLQEQGLAVFEPHVLADSEKKLDRWHIL